MDQTALSYPHPASNSHHPTPCLYSSPLPRSSYLHFILSLSSSSPFTKFFTRQALSFLWFAVISFVPGINSFPLSSVSVSHTHTHIHKLSLISLSLSFYSIPLIQPHFYSLIDPFSVTSSHSLTLTIIILSISLSLSVFCRGTFSK